MNKSLVILTLSLLVGCGGTPVTPPPESRYLTTPPDELEEIVRQKQTAEAEVRQVRNEARATYYDLERRYRFAEQGERPELMVALVKAEAAYRNAQAALFQSKEELEAARKGYLSVLLHGVKPVDATVDGERTQAASVAQPVHRVGGHKQRRLSISSAKRAEDDVIDQSEEEETGEQAEMDAPTDNEAMTTETVLESELSVDEPTEPAPAEDDVRIETPNEERGGDAEERESVQALPEELQLPADANIFDFELPELSSPR